MPGGAGSISARTEIHHHYGWILVPVEVYGDMVLEMVLDTWSPRSSISDGIRVRLARLGLLEPVGPATYLLRDLRIAGQSVPDLEVYVSRRVTLVGRTEPSD